MAETQSLRCMWEITAGLIPGRPDEEYTKRFHLTSEEWDDGSNKGVEAFMAKQGEAMIHALSLQHPTGLNWTRLDWIWF